jgi:flagellar biosynthetic protein FliO
MTSSILPSVLALLFVLGIIPVSLWVLKQSKGLGNKQLKGNVQNQLSLIHRLQVGPREQIAVLQVAGKTLVVGITAQTIQTLAELESVAVDEALVNANTNDSNVIEQASTFQSLLARMKRS